MPPEPTEEPSTLTRLMYASETAEALNPATLQALLDHARAANERRNITGMLSFDSRYFLQVLEGDRQAVNEVFSRIAADSRHRRVEVLEVAAADERRFARWGTEPNFNPYTMTATSSHALLGALNSSA